MKKLFRKAKELRSKAGCDHWDCPEVVEKLSVEYQNIPKNIIKYFFVRHAMQGEETMRGIDNINAKNIIILEEYLTNKDLINNNVISFASFNKSDKFKNYIADINHNKRIFFNDGTWNAPIIAIEQDGKLLVIDGTMRFQTLRALISNEDKNINDSHLVNIIRR